MKAGVVLGHLKDAGNEGALLRSAEAFGINHVHVIGERRAEYGAAQGADRHQTFFEYESLTGLADHLRAENCSLVAVENVEWAVPITEVDRYPVNPVFVVGHENGGVPLALLDAAERVVSIPQSATGYTRCLNAAVAGSLVICDWFQTVHHPEVVADGD